MAQGVSITLVLDYSCIIVVKNVALFPWQMPWTRKLKATVQGSSLAEWLLQTVSHKKSFLFWCLCYRGISQKETEQVAKQSMKEENLTTKISILRTADLARCRWPTPGPIPTVRSSLSVPGRCVCMNDPFAKWFVVHCLLLTVMPFFNLLLSTSYLRHLCSICNVVLLQTPWLNGKHTVFGKVTNGLDVVKKINAYGTEFGKPQADITITDCGAL